MAIPPSAISDELNWMKVARALAHEARVFQQSKGKSWEILDEASRDARRIRRGRKPRAFSKIHGRGHGPGKPNQHRAPSSTWPESMDGRGGLRRSLRPGQRQWSGRAAELQVSFSNIPHRRWLYGTYLIRGEITVAGRARWRWQDSARYRNGRRDCGRHGASRREDLGRHDLKVLYINAEDSRTEIKRRIWAFCLAHANKIAEQNLDRLYVAGAD